MLSTRWWRVALLLAACVVPTSASASVVRGSARHLQTIESFRRSTSAPRTVVPADSDAGGRRLTAVSTSAHQRGMKLRKLRTKSDNTEMGKRPTTIKLDLQNGETAAGRSSSIAELLAPWLACFGLDREVMTRMVDDNGRETSLLVNASSHSFARMVNTRRRRLTTLSRCAFFKPDLSIRDGDFIQESSFNSHWTRAEAYLMLKALQERPPRPDVVRRRRWRPGDTPPGLLAVPEAEPGEPVVAGAVMAGPQSLDLVKEEDTSEMLHRRLDVLCLLDLDMTCFWGNDANDLGCAMQWMARPRHLLRQLYSILWNPAASAAIADLRTTHNTEIVVYTMRGALLNYRSPFRRLTLSLQWDPSWHYEQVTIVDNEAVPQQVLSIPGDVKTAADILDTYSGVEDLLERERADLGFCFERLLAARDVLQEKLSLREAPRVLVTSTVKDVVYAARCVGHVGGNARAFLWDDNEKLWNRRNVLPVDKYDALAEPAYTELQSFLSEHLAPHDLDPGLVRFLQGAPAATRVLEEVWGAAASATDTPKAREDNLKNESGNPGDGGSRLQYVIPRASHIPPQWSLPSLPGLKDLRSGLLSLRTWSKTLLRVGSEVDAIVRRVYSSSSFGAKHDVALTDAAA